MCNGTETTAVCPADCPCTSSPDNCTGENVCVNGACVSAFGRNYRICVGSGVFGERDAMGDPWDSVGGLPDPFVKVTINGMEVRSTTAKQDTTMPVWNECVSAIIAAGTSFAITAFDEDVASNDEMFGCTNNPLTAATIRLRTLMCSSGAASAAGTGSSFTFTLEP